MGLNQETLISVIITFYNEKDYFDECFLSVINKTYKNLMMTAITFLLFTSCASKEDKKENNLETATENVSESVKNFNSNVRNFIKKNKTDKSDEENKKNKK